MFSFQEAQSGPVSPTTQASAAAAACVKKPDFCGEVAPLTTEDEALVNGAITDADRANGDEERGL